MYAKYFKQLGYEDHKVASTSYIWWEIVLA